MINTRFLVPEPTDETITRLGHYGSVEGGIPPLPPLSKTARLTVITAAALLAAVGFAAEPKVGHTSLTAAPNSLALTENSCSSVLDPDCIPTFRLPEEVRQQVLSIAGDRAATHCAGGAGGSSCVTVVHKDLVGRDEE